MAGKLTFVENPVVNWSLTLLLESAFLKRAGFGCFDNLKIIKIMRSNLTGTKHGLKFSCVDKQFLF